VASNLSAQLASFQNHYYFPSYDGALTDEQLLKVALDEGPKTSSHFRNLIQWIAEEIHGLGKLEERVNISKPLPA
jgi:hypothetical protein